MPELGTFICIFLKGLSFSLQGTPQEVLNPSVSGPSSVTIVGQDPFSWPLETFNQPILASNLVCLSALTYTQTESNF